MVAKGGYFRGRGDGGEGCGSSGIDGADYEGLSKVDLPAAAGVVLRDRANLGDLRSRSQK